LTAFGNPSNPTDWQRDRTIVVVSPTRRFEPLAIWLPESIESALDQIIGGVFPNFLVSIVIENHDIIE